MRKVLARRRIVMRCGCVVEDGAGIATPCPAIRAAWLEARRRAMAFDSPIGLSHSALLGLKEHLDKCKPVVERKAETLPMFDREGTHDVLQ